MVARALWLFELSIQSTDKKRLQLMCEEDSSWCVDISFPDQEPQTMGSSAWTKCIPSGLETLWRPTLPMASWLALSGHCLSGFINFLWHHKGQFDAPLYVWLSYIRGPLCWLVQEYASLSSKTRLQELCYIHGQHHQVCHARRSCLIRPKNANFIFKPFGVNVKSW
jgi:hypothetical protein